jgi:hypothetical protein
MEYWLGGYLFQTALRHVQEHGVPQLLNLLSLNYITLCTLFEIEFTDIQQKLATFSYILEILNNAFEPALLQKFSRMTIYNVLALHIVVYGREIWTFRRKDKNDWHRDESFQKKKTVGYTHIKQKKRMKKFWKRGKVEPVDEKLRR